MGRGDVKGSQRGVFSRARLSHCTLMCCPCDLLKCGKLNGIICAGEGLHSQLLLKKNKRKERQLGNRVSQGRDVLEWGWGWRWGFLRMDVREYD